MAIYRELGNRLGEANVLTNLGLVRNNVGDYAEATGLHQQALVIYRELGNRLGEAEVLNRIGTLLLKNDEPHNALEKFTDALTQGRAIHSPLEQAHALEGSARCRVNLGDTATAIAELRKAVEIYRRLTAPEADSAAAYLATLEPTSRSR